MDSNATLIPGNRLFIALANIKYDTGSVSPIYPFLR